MNKTLTEIMKASLESLRGKWLLAIGTFIIYGLLVGAMQYASQKYPVSSIIFLLLGGPIGLGIAVFSLNLSRGEDARFEQIFDGFNNFVTALSAYLLMLLFIFLWLLLLIIPGIIAAISYSMVFYIIADEESIRAMDALNKSKKMMDGYKWKFFFLGLRFFGLALLCVLTLGIGFFFLIPYAHVTIAKFYDDIKDTPIREGI